MVKRHRHRDREWDIFLSYAGENRAHAESLHRLLDGPVRVFLDKVSIPPGDDWPESIADALAHSKIIAVLITEATDRASFQAEEIIRALEQAKLSSARVVPVVIGDVREIPFGLSRKQAIFVADPASLDAAAAALIDVVEGEASSDERSFSPSIREYFASLRHTVDRLTSEQFRALAYMKHMRRVRISGTAGSGKTIVAAEKASRLAAAGQAVLFLCHNPLLARHVANLTRGTGVVAIDFGSWIAHITGSAGAGLEMWQVFDEPDEAMLNGALRAIESAKTHFDAVIVDEAQDFRDAWWDLVQAALRPDGVFYLFHDNHQSLLPHRGNYPIDEPHIDLSRNCRNAGKIFELMRCFDGSLPETEVALRSKGHVRLTLYEPGQEVENLSAVLASEVMTHAQPVIVWSAPEPIAESPLVGIEMRITTTPWRKHVEMQFHRILTRYDKDGVTVPSSANKRVEQTMAALSLFPFPTSVDVERVGALARTFRVEKRKRPLAQPKRAPKEYPAHIMRRHRRLLTERPPEPTAADALLRFVTGEWVNDLPQRTLQTAAFHDPFGIFRIPVYGVPDFKGLEADMVILFMRGYATSHRQATYVGISRARLLLWILADRTASAALPRDFIWDTPGDDFEWWP